MNKIQQTMLEEIYTHAITVAREKNQVLHEDGEDKLRGSYFITIQQIEETLKAFED